MQNSHKWLSRFRLKSSTWVYVPTLETLKEGAFFKKLIELKWFPPSNYYHLKNGGHVEAVKCHLGGKYFVCVDIKKFFNSINRSRITRELKPYFGYEKSRAIAMESTVSIPLVAGQIFALPFGFVQSTIIASLCLRKSSLGKTIDSLNKSEGVRVSVYVDDIIVSTQCLEKAEAALLMIQKSAERSGFLLNQEKSQGPCDSITVFNIELRQGFMSIVDWRFNELLFNYKEALSEKQKTGIWGYVNSVSPVQALMLL
ncbi:reverse transcriptase domain-containing protein [Pseudomonas parakoreensis]|uniref:reverse transcriptase domain-containing protein n=1 Tax=Pseudomonas parakoreensis TaxID=2892331 RepID=UPI00103D65FD|nr:reverse transcriptase domain-containing protein [Pseudomonas parakoreensis]